MQMLGMRKNYKLMTTKNNIPAGYKDSAVGIIPQEWEVKTFQECFHISAGRDLQKEYYSEKQTLQYQYPIFSNSLENRGLYGYTSNPRHKAGSITITGRGMLGVAEYRDVDFDAIVRLLVLYPKKEIAGQVVTEYINYRKPFYFESTGVPQLTAPQISNIPIPVPPLAEQRKIAEILGVWDEAIEKQSRLIEKLELRKRALMQRLLTGRTRLPGFTSPWQKVKLGETGKIKKGVQVNKDTLQEYGKYPTINGGIEPSGYSDNYNTEANTITISEGGNSCGYVNFITTKFWSGGHCYTIIPNDNIIKPYLFQQLKYLEPHIMNLRVGSGLPNIQLKTLTKLRCSLPSLPEQKAIAEVLTTADKEIATHRKKLDALRLQKRGLMQQLLTGKTRVKI